jgi:vitamin B12/bleomycin/antimicrobial peptide transport system ATP-binding/permease protein
MTVLKVPISRATWRRFVEMIKGIAADPAVGHTAVLMFVGLIVLLVAVNVLNVVNSYVGRDFMTSVEQRDLRAFWSYAALYVGVFAISTLVAVFYRFVEERLGLLWRKWLTERALGHYLEDRTYLRLHQAGDVPNPDQRISEDIRALTATTLSFVLMFLNATFTVVAFSGVLWSISPQLFAVAVAYAVLGSAVTVAIGKRLVPLNYDQLDKEANFRARLVHVRENAESIALLQREGRLKARLLSRLDALTDNFRLIINVNRNLGFFTTGYNYLIQIIPALLVAPLFIAGQAEFGVITQSAVAFGHLLGAFSLIVTQFQSISNYTAVIARLSALREAMDRARVATAPTIELCTTCAQVAYEHLTLTSPRSGRTLVGDLSLAVPVGAHLLIRTRDESAGHALFRATADLWETGRGRILRPGSEDILFLPEKPYLPPGTLREVLLRTEQLGKVADQRILDTLQELALEQTLTRAGGLDTEHQWADILSLGEQQLLAFSRVLLAAPEFVFLDHPTRALSECQVGELLGRLRAHMICYLTLGDEDDDPSDYDQLLEIAADGTWTLREAAPSRQPQAHTNDPGRARPLS